MAQPALTSREMADEWHVTPDTAVRWAHQGRVTAIRSPGGQWRFFGPLPATSAGGPSHISEDAEDQTDAR